MIRFTVFLFSFFYGYAVLRYHVGKSIPWNEWLFILNKAFAWMGFTLIALSVLKEKTLSKFKLNRRSLGMSGFLFVLYHATTVLILFNEDHYPKFYSDHSINLIGWITIVIGILSLVVFLLPFVAALKKLPNTSKVFKLGKIGLVISMCHPLLIGFKDWFLPGEWPLYMPPITMLAVVVGVVVLGKRSL